MIVVVAGGYGCGTTHVYRIAIAVLDAAGRAPEFRGVSAADWHTVTDGRRPLVVKTHNAVAPPGPTTRVILCERDVLDAAASILRRRPESEMLKGLGQRVELERGYAGRDDVLRIDYELDYGFPRRKIQRIAQHVGVELSPMQLERVHNATSIATTLAEQATLTGASPTELRPDHIGPAGGAPGAGVKLPPDVRARIRATYEDPSTNVT